MVTGMDGRTNSSRANRDRPAHHGKSGFRNPFLKGNDKKIADIVKWKLLGEGAKGTENEAGAVPKVTVNHQALRRPGPAPQATWIGHSTVLLQLGGQTIITDPIFSERCSPLPFAGPKRFQPPALKVEELPPIDFALISHNHYDHLDKKSVLALGENVHWLVPLGVREWFLNLGIKRVTELDWWEEVTIGKTRFVATPTQHWSARGVGDRFQSLWASWLVEVEGTRFWFGGDTGYNDTQFKEIGRRFAPIHLAAIPIGAYEPRWFMKDMHVNPAEAVQIHQDIGALTSFGIHWGTFRLTDEAPLDPRDELERATAAAGLEEGAFTTLAIGETRIVARDLLNGSKGQIHQHSGSLGA